MKVLFLNAWENEGGAARAALRLLKGMQQRGMDVRMLVKKLSGSHPGVFGPSGRVDRIAAYVRPMLEHHCIRRYPQWNGLTFSPALFPDRLLRQVAAVSPELIHLHWMGDAFLKVETLTRFRQPLVWTLHDSWPFTGGCHIPFDCTGYRGSCGRCPALGSLEESDLSRQVWRRKQRAWRDLDLTVVSPSRWLADCARSSSLFAETRVEVIPNGLDLGHYHPVDKKVARAALSLPMDKKLILFGGMHSTRDPNKGFHLLASALEELAAQGWGSRSELLVFGSEQPADPVGTGISARYLGWLHDDISLALYYAASDVFVFPSIQEALGYTAMEAMACGTPCVAFNQGGVPDLVDHEQNGYLARPYEPGDLARGIAWVLDDERCRALPALARQKVEREFSLDHVAQRHAALYEELMAAKR